MAKYLEVETWEPLGVRWNVVGKQKTYFLIVFYRREHKDFNLRILLKAQSSQSQFGT